MPQPRKRHSLAQAGAQSVAQACGVVGAQAWKTTPNPCFSCPPTQPQVGGTSPEPEFNLASDPEAAKIVLDKFFAASVSSSGLQGTLVLVGLDMSEQHPLHWSVVDGWAERDTQKARFFSGE